MAPGSITARRSSLGAASGGGGSSSHTTVNTGPFTPQQQRALMKLAGGPLAQNATGNPYQYHQQQQQYAMMVQMRALAAAVEQQRSAAAYLQPGFPLQHVVQQQQQRRQIGGPLGFNAYPAVPQVYPPRPAMHPAPLPAAPHHHHLPLYAINNGNGDGSSSFEGGVLVQHQFQPSNSNSQSTFLQNYYSPSLHHQSPPPPPPPTSIQSSSQQYRFVGGEPTNSYRLVTQSQLAHQQHLQTDIGTPTVGPALPTPALKTADNASAGPKASIGDFHCSSTSHEPTKIADMMMSPTTMPAEEEEAGQQQQQQWQQQAGQRSNSSSMSSIDMSHAAIPGAGLLPNASSRSPPSAMQQQHEGGNIRLLSASSPLLPAAAAQQSHGIEVTSSTSDKGQDLAASLNPGIPPTSDSDTAHAVASATPRPTATASSGKTAGDNTITQKGSTQISPTSSTSYSSTVNPSSSPRAEPLNMPKGQHAKNTSQKNANGKKPPRKQKQARRPTLTVDTSILPDQATVPPAAAVVRNPVADVAPAQIPSNSIYQVTAGLQHPSYVVEMQPVQTAPTFTQASPPGYATLRTLQLNNALTAAFKKQEGAAIDRCIAEFFHKDGKFKFSMSEEGRDEPSNEYLIPTCAIPRFYESMRRCGATSIQLVLDDPQEWLLGAESGTVMTEDGTSGYMVECPNATLIVSYSTGSTVFARGTCRATYHYHQQQTETLIDKHGRLLSLSNGYPQMTLLLSQLEYDFVEHTEMVNRSAIKIRNNHMVQGQGPSSMISLQTNTDNTEPERPSKRPKMDSYTSSNDDTSIHQTTQGTQTSLKRSESGSAWQECSIPGPPVRDTGLSDESMRVLEIGEAVDHLGELICFSLINNLSPLEALEHYATLSVKAGFVPDPRLSETGHGLRPTQDT